MDEPVLPDGVDAILYSYFPLTEAARLRHGRFSQRRPSAQRFSYPEWGTARWNEASGSGQILDYPGAIEVEPVVCTIPVDVHAIECRSDDDDS